MTNTAYRVLRAVEAVRERRSPKNEHASIEIAHVAMDILGIEKIDPSRVAATILGLHDQVILLEEELDEWGVPSNLYSSYLKVLKRQFLPTATHTSWQEYQKPFSPEIAHIVHWAALLMATQEDELSDTDLIKLTEQAEQLEALSATPGIPLGLKKLLQRQSRDLMAAIADYPVKGLAPLQKAMKTGAGDIASEVQALKDLENATSEEKRSIVPKIFGAVTTAANVIDRVAKTGGSVGAIYKVTAAAIKTLSSPD